MEGEYTENERKKIVGDNLVRENRFHVGTLKTLRDDLTAMKIMGELCGALTFYASRYVNANLNRYKPTAERQKMNETLQAKEQEAGAEKRGASTDDKKEEL